MSMALEQKTDIFEPCPSPSLGWLSPARVSFSKDFPPHELEPVGIGIGIGPSANDVSCLRGKERLAKDSMSDFEFTMAMVECDRAADHGKHMLAADELFFKGKLLPLYVPQYVNDDAAEGTTAWQQPARKVAHRFSDSDMNLLSSSSSSWFSSLSSSSSMSCSPLGHGLLPASRGTDPAKIVDLANMASPKPPKCSSKLRDLFGLKRSTAALPLPSTLKSAKTPSKGDTEHRKASMEVMPTFQTLCKAKRLFCKTDKRRRKASEDRCSTSDPFLLAKCDGTARDARLSIGCPVVSLPPQHQSLHQTSSSKSHVAGVSHTPSSLCSQITRMHRSNRVSDHGDDAFTKAPSQQHSRVLKEVKNTDKYSSMRALTSCRKVPIKEDLKPTVYRASRRPALQGFAYYGGSGESSPGRRSSGAISPAGSSGQWSPGRLSSAVLMSGHSTTCSSCRGSPGRHSTSGVTPCYSPGRVFSGIEQLSLSALDTGHERFIRESSLERSSSYSPKRLQRKFDQMKALRQRDGWRPGIERSLSYNNMSTMRVAPVLNVPRVCTLNRSSKTSSSYVQANSNCGNGGGGLGLGHLFSSKAQCCKFSASSKLQELKHTSVSWRC